MEINEINTLTLSNPNAFLRDNANYQTSDELNVGENNVQYGESKFARNKRIGKTVAKVTAFTALLITALASGSYIVNSFLGSDPTISNVSESYVVEDNLFKYEFDVTIEQTVLDMHVFRFAALIEEVSFNKSGVYSGEISVEEAGEYTVKFISTNGFDYSKEIESYRITFVVE